MSNKKENEKIYMIINMYTGEAKGTYKTEKAAIARYAREIKKTEPVMLTYTTK